MLALRTGWTPDVMADLPSRFRAACHWALYAQAIAGPEGLPPITGTGLAAGAERAARLTLNTALYPEGDDG